MSALLHHYSPTGSANPDWIRESRRLESEADLGSGPLEPAPEPMDALTRQLVRAWLADYHGDTERTARWMADSLRIGDLTACRALVWRAREGA